MGKFSDVCDSAWVVCYYVLSLDVNLARWGHSVSIASEDTDDSTFTYEQRDEISRSASNRHIIDFEQSVQGEEKKESERSKIAKGAFGSN